MMVGSLIGIWKHHLFGTGFITEFCRSRGDENLACGWKAFLYDVPFVRNVLERSDHILCRFSFVLFFHPKGVEEMLLVTSANEGEGGYVFTPFCLFVC